MGKQINPADIDKLLDKYTPPKKEGIKPEDIDKLLQEQTPQPTPQANTPLPPTTLPTPETKQFPYSLAQDIQYQPPTQPTQPLPQPAPAEHTQMRPPPVFSLQEEALKRLKLAQSGIPAVPLKELPEKVKPSEYTRADAMGLGILHGVAPLPLQNYENKVLARVIKKYPWTFRLSSLGTTLLTMLPFVKGAELLTQAGVRAIPQALLNKKGAELILAKILPTITRGSLTFATYNGFRGILEKAVNKEKLSKKTVKGIYKNIISGAKSGTIYGTADLVANPTWGLLAIASAGMIDVLQDRLAHNKKITPDDWKDAVQNGMLFALLRLVGFPKAKEAYKVQKLLPEVRNTLVDIIKGRGYPEQYADMYMLRLLKMAEIHPEAITPKNLTNLVSKLKALPHYDPNLPVPKVLKPPPNIPKYTAEIMKAMKIKPEPLNIKTEQPLTQPTTPKVSEVDINKLAIKPEQYQYKRHLGPGGVSSKLKGIKKYEPELGGIISVWKNPEDGKTYVINGHHRYELAKRSGEKKILVRHITASNPEEARLKGALINIAEGQGTAMDAAYIFKKNNITPEQLGETYNISLKESVAKKGMGLAGLSPKLFLEVQERKIPENWGVVIGENLRGNPTAQDEILKFLKREKGKHKDITPGVIEQVIKDLANTGVKMESKNTLFGKEIKMRPLLMERALLRDYAIRRALRDKNLFKTASVEGKVKTLEEAGNKMAVETNKKLAKESEQVAEAIDKLSGLSGKINDVIKKYAEEVSNAKTKGEKDKLLIGFYDEIKDAVRQEVRFLQKEVPKGNMGNGGRGLFKTTTKQPKPEAKPIEKPKPAVKPTQKEPWQMTKKEFVGQEINTPTVSNDLERWRLKNKENYGKPSKVVKKNNLIYEFHKTNDTPDKDGTKSLGLVITKTPNGNIVGYSEAFYRGDTGTNVGTVEVHPKYRRQGIATNMYNMLENMLKIKLSEDTGNTLYAQAFWRAREHKQGIEQALKQGKPVPPEVLKDYPDLVKKYKPQPTPEKPAGIPKELEPLAKEARKYKSAEEFAKAMTKKTKALLPKGTSKEKDFNFISRDGELLKNIGKDHNATVSKILNLEDFGKDNIRIFLDSGNIRADLRNNELSLNIGAKPTEQQLKTIKENFLDYGGYWKNDVFIDIEQNGKLIASKRFEATKYKPEEIIKYIKDNATNEPFADFYIQATKSIKPEKQVEKQGLEQKAIKHFGLTDNPNEGGFLLPDGKMLDFSGKKWGSPAGKHSLDHSEIGQVVKGGIKEFQHKTDAVRFFLTGNQLNISLYTGQKVSKKQWDELAKMSYENKANIFYDIINSKTGKLVDSGEAMDIDILERIFRASKKKITPAPPKSAPSPLTKSEMEKITQVPIFMIMFNQMKEKLAQGKLLKDIKSVNDLLSAIKNKLVEAKEDKIIKKAYKLGTKAGRERARKIIAERKARVKLRQEIKKKAKKIVKLNTKGLPKRYADQINRIKARIDPSFRTKKTLAKREGFREFVKKEIEAGHEIMIPDKLIERMSKVSLSEMTPAEFEEIYNATIHLYQTGKTLQKLLSRRQQADYNKAKEEMLKALQKRPAPIQEELPRAPESKSVKTKLKEWGKAFDLKALPSIYVFQRLDGGKSGIFTDLFFHGAGKAERIQIKLQDKFNNDLTDFLKQHNLNEEKLRFKVQKINDRTALSPAQKIGVYIASKNKNALRSIKLTNKFTDKDINDVINSLKPEEKALGDWIVKYNDKMYPVINKTHRDLFGFDMPQEPFYSRIIRMMGEGDLPQGKMAELEQMYKEQGNYRQPYAQRGFTKARVKVSETTPPQVLDVLYVFHRHALETAHFISYGKLIRDLRKVVNDKDIMKGIVKYRNKAYTNWLMRWTQDVAKVGYDKPPMGQLANLSAFLRHNVVSAITLGNLLMSAKQPLSFMLGVNEIGEKWALKGLNKFYSNPKQAIRLISKLAPQYSPKHRFIERDIREMMNTGIYSRIGRGYKKMRMPLTFALRVGDAMGVIPIWLGAIEKGMEEKGLTLKEAIKYGAEVIEKTQPTTGKSSLPEFIKAPAEISKIMTQFVNQRVKNLSYAREEMLPSLIHPMERKLKTGKGLGFGLKSLIYATLIGLLYGIISRGRRQKNKKEIAIDILGFYTGGIPYLGNIITAVAQGYEPSPPMMSAYKDWWRIFSVKKPATRRKYIVKSITELTGLPYVQPKRTLDAIENILGKQKKGQSINIKDLQLFLWSKYMLGLKKAKKTKPVIKGFTGKSQGIKPLTKGGGL